MIPIATVNQMRECDRFTIDELGIPGILLMETAARAVTDKSLELLQGRPQSKKVTLYCGKGNNGGDGFAIARHLHNLGMNVRVMLMGTINSLKGDALFNAGLFRGTIIEKPDPDMFSSDWWLDDGCDMIIDALLGTGFKGRVRDDYATVIKYINNQDVPVISVDIPSGVAGDTGIVQDLATEADMTVTFGLIKPGLVLYPGREYAGQITVADIGIPTDVVENQNITCFQVERSDIVLNLPKRSITAHKGEVGHVYILAGSTGMSGAATLSAEASIRTGSGLTLVGVPQSINPILEIRLAESITQSLPENKHGFMSVDGFSQILERFDWADAVAFGPGIGQDQTTADLLEKILQHIKKPLVIDADGLNLLANNPHMLKILPHDTVLTPHPGEFARLTGLTTKKINANRIELTRKYANKWGVAILLKGAPTITALPNRSVFVNSTGNPGMATGGSGDVLTGIIVSLAAQGVPIHTAAWMGAYIHGKAGDSVAEKKGQAGMIASDIINALPETILLSAGINE